MKGGARQGAGRPKGGGKNIRREIQADFSEKDIQRVLDKAHELALKGDSLMIKFLLEQFYGKAPQRVEVSGNAGGPIQISWVK